MGRHAKPIDQVNPDSLKHNKARYLERQLVPKSPVLKAATGWSKDFCNKQSPTSLALMECLKRILKIGSSHTFFESDRINLELAARALYQAERLGAKPVWGKRYEDIATDLGLTRKGQARAHGRYEGSGGDQRVEQGPKNPFSAIAAGQSSTTIQ